ncbi:MAG: PTS sugar transporter subunit IIA [Holdemania massiliensis]
MKGILLLSHGDMAQGMLQASSIFFGENLPQVQALGYQMTDDSEAFEEQIGQAVAKLDSGEGVLILTDLFGGHQP